MLVAAAALWAHAQQIQLVVHDSIPARAGRLTVQACERAKHQVVHLPAPHALDVIVAAQIAIEPHLSAVRRPQPQHVAQPRKDLKIAIDGSQADPRQLPPHLNIELIG